MTRYFVTGDCNCPEPTEHEVSKADFVRAERRAGFHNTMGYPNEPATHSFSSTRFGVTISGRQEESIEDALEELNARAN